MYCSIPFRYRYLAKLGFLCLIRLDEQAKVSQVFSPFCNRNDHAICYVELFRCCSKLRTQLI